MFEKNIMDSIHKSYGWDQNIKIIHTGFSLGGFIAAACVIKKYDTNNRYAVTFDSPGYDYLLPSKPNEKFKEHFINYVAYPNLINTCQSHIGKIIQIFKPGTPNADIINISVIEIFYTYSNHQIRKFVDVLSKGIKLYPVICNWPKAEYSSEIVKLMNRFELRTDDGFNQVASSLYELVKNINYKRSNKVDYDF
jgi:hypothetical protein